MSIEFIKVKDIANLGDIYLTLKDLDNYYPQFSEWYFNKFIPSVLLDNDIALVMKRGGEFAGVSLLKKSEDETKLRAMRVHPKFKNRGYGLYLLDESLRLLDHPLPHCTVPEELIDEYSRIFVNRYGFKLDYVDRNIYRRGKNEYYWNIDR